MATLTQNYGLTKPDQNDFYNIDDMNLNADIIDMQFKSNLDSTGRAQQAADQAQTDNHRQDQQILALSQRVTQNEADIDRIEGALLTNITSNEFSVRFDDLDGVTVTGVWNVDEQRIEC